MNPKFQAALVMNAINASLTTYRRLCEKFEPDALDRGEEIWNALGLSRGAKKNLARIMNGLSSRDWAERELERVKKYDARFITVDDPDYPSRLLDLDRPPIGLYVRGPAELALPSVAVVGTRKCSSYGKSVAEALGRELAHMRMTVISGGARGIDAASHRGALSMGGVTIAIMGTGLDRTYPTEHRDLFERISESGALITEFPMGSNGEMWHFPERNRLVVAMSGRTVVVESPADGGAMITARIAQDLGREVWAVPGQINESVCEGSNALLAENAMPLVNIQDFVKRIAGTYGQLVLDLDLTGSVTEARSRVAGTTLAIESEVFVKPETEPVSRLETVLPTRANPILDSGPALSPDEKAILAILRRQGNRTVDDIIAESTLGFVTVQTCIVTLSACGLIVSSGPGRYSASA